MPLVPNVEANNTRLRAKLASLLSGPPPRNADILVTHIEVNDRHGVGVLTRTLFADRKDVVTVRSADHFGGDQDFGMRAERIAHTGPRADAYGEVWRRLSDLEPRRILATPYYPDDVRTAIALKDIFGVPLCTYLMDDQNVHADGIGDAEMRELLTKSELRLAISPELRAAYEAKYGLPFAFMPPVVREHLVLSSPRVPSRSELELRRGVVVGNIWSQRWLDLLRATMKGAGIELDWYCNSGLMWTTCTVEALASDGIHAHGAVPDEQLVDILRARPFVVVPSGTMDVNDDRRFLAALSLPSRITYVAAASNTPMIVLGSAQTAAARFVTRAGIGLSVPYESRKFVAAVDELISSEVQERARQRAATMAPALSARGALEWIWASLARGRPLDDRFESLAFAT